MGCEKKTSIGGQALIEGIMMKGPHKTVVACRLPDGSVSVEDYQSNSITKKYKWLGLPVIRGVVNLVESMIFGYKAMMLSAERSGMLDDLDDKKQEPEVEAEVAEQEATEAADESTDEQPNESGDDEPVDADKAEAEAEEIEETEAEVAEEAEDTAEESGEEVTEESMEENVEEAAQETADVEPVKEKTGGENSVLMAIVSVISVILGVGLAIVLFMYLPHVLFTKLNALEGVNLTPYQALFEGSIKLVIFFAYMLAVSYMKDIRRVFMYHGAEHKAIFCYENGLELNVENVRKQKRFHPRCGTSFLILMIIVSIIVCQLLLFIPGINTIATSDELVNKLIWVFLKIVTLPVVCGLGYELIKICGRHDNIITKIISAPGLWLQRISTKEPDDAMIEVAIASIEAVIPENEEDDRW